MREPTRIHAKTHTPKQLQATGTRSISKQLEATLEATLGYSELL